LLVCESIFICFILHATEAAKYQKFAGLRLGITEGEVRSGPERAGLYLNVRDMKLHGPMNAERVSSA
jgi:hypothetical protein